MDDLEIKIQALLNEIENSFRNNKYPGDENLLHEDCLGDDNDIVDFYGQSDWKKVPNKILEVNDASLCFFSPSAYQFYLPAYMQWALRNYRKKSFFGIDTTIYSLNPLMNDETDTRNFTESKYSKLTQDQKQVVVKFLEFMRDHGEGRVDSEQADNALQDYWYKKCSCN